MREQVSYQLGEQIRKRMVRALYGLREWFRARSQRQRRLISGGLSLVVVAVLALVAAMPAMTSASETDALSNGGFEHGFRQVNGCGVVGYQWDCFTNGGAANYGFYDDQWELVVYEGKSSQLIEINTKEMAAGDNDRYAGISQTARVVPGKSYKLSLRGMIRTTNSEGDPWRYSVQVGWLDGPQGDWRDVENWTDVGWNSYYKRTEPGAFSAYQTQLVPHSELVTVFVRVWKKWGVAYEELDVNLDAISLTGPAAHHPQQGPQQGPGRPDERYDGIGGPVGQPDYGPQQGPSQSGPQQGQKPEYRGEEPRHEEPRQPQAQSYRPAERDHDYPLSCGGEELIYNGSFEAGFVEVPWGEVGRGWDAFTNGGAANYGFYDEEWDVVVADGHHGQLVEINTNSVYPTDPDRYAGIYQRIGGLHPGATYELTLRGELRGMGNEDDPHRFGAQWGLGKEANWQSVEEWTTIDLGPIAVRTQPVPLAQYKVRFEAPAPSVNLFIRGWKKFAVTNVEMDLNLDAISLRACDGKGPDKDWNEDDNRQGPSPWAEERGIGGPVNEGPGYGGETDHAARNEGGNCLYVVKPGDMLSQIALDHGVNMEVIIRANGIDDPSAIYVGQKFEIPGCKSGERNSRPESRHEGPAQAEREQGPSRQQYEITQAERPSDEPKRSGPAMRPDAGDHKQSGARQESGPAAQPERQASSRTYTVRGGDMLTAIAQEYGVNAYELAAYNGIDNMNVIYVGQVLRIPN